MKKSRNRINSGIQWLLTAVIAGSFIFTQSASATIARPTWDLPSLTVEKEGDVPGQFFIAPLLSSPHYDSFVLNPGEFKVFDIPYVFYIGEKMTTPLVDITISPSGDLLGGLEIRNIFGYEYAGYAGVCKGDCTVTFTNTEVPLPTAAWLFGSGLLFLAGITRRRLPKRGCDGND